MQILLWSGMLQSSNMEACIWACIYLSQF